MAPRKRPVNLFIEEFRKLEDERRRLSGETEEVLQSEFSKMAANRWKALPSEEKERYKQLLEEEKAKNPTPAKKRSRSSKSGKGKENKDDEGKENKDEDEDEEAPKPKKKKEKKKKDPNAPKLPMTNYFLFCNDMRAQVKTENPTFSSPELSKEMGRLWKELNSEEKAKYDVIAKENRKKYDEELAAYTKSKEAAEVDGEGESEGAEGEEGEIESAGPSSDV